MKLLTLAIAIGTIASTSWADSIEITNTIDDQAQYEYCKIVKKVEYIGPHSKTQIYYTVEGTDEFGTEEISTSLRRYTKLARYPGDGWGPPIYQAPTAKRLLSRAIEKLVDEEICLKFRK